MKRKLTLIINGMFYGDGYTKRMLWSAFLLGVFSIGSLLAGLALGFWPCYIAALAMASGDAFLMHSMHLDVDTIGGEEDEQDEELQQEEKTEEEQKKEPLKKESLKNKSSKNETTLKGAVPKQDKDNAMKAKGKTQGNVKEKNSGKKTGTDADSTEDYSEKEIKKLFYTYKVKKNHRPVLIDSSKKYRIKECPAYIWTHQGQLHILLLEKEARKLSLPLSEVQKMYYEKSVPANQKKEYDCLVEGPGMISMVFSEYRPVYQSIIKDKRQVEVKNLYRIGTDIRFTAPSARELLELLQPEFVVDDEIMRSDDYNQYFKQIYKQKILLNDGALNMNQYQTRIKSILQKLSEAPITPAAFRMTLSDMAGRGLISNEYVSYYTQYNRQYRERNRK